MSDSLWPHELQHVRLPCPSLSPEVCSNSCPLNQWCHPTISSSVSPFSSFPQSFSFSSVQSLSHVRLFATPWIAACLPVRHQLPEFTQTHVHRVSDAIQPSHPLSSPSSPATLFSSCPQSFPIDSFPMSQLFASGIQNIGASVSTSVLPMTI